MLARRDALSEAGRRTCGAGITAKLLELPGYLNAGRVMAYLSFGSEFDTAALVADLRSRNKVLVLPRVERRSRELTLHEVRDLAGEIEAGAWGIRQPRADCPPAEPGAIDFVLVPGVAFTRQGARLGYGGGYYDRFIRGLTRRPVLVAAAFEAQLLDELPMSDADQWIDRVVTEKGVYTR